MKPAKLIQSNHVDIYVSQKDIKHTHLDFVSFLHGPLRVRKLPNYNSFRLVIPSIFIPLISHWSLYYKPPVNMPILGTIFIQKLILTKYFFDFLNYKFSIVFRQRFFAFLLVANYFRHLKFMLLKNLILPPSPTLIFNA